MRAGGGSEGEWLRDRGASGITGGGAKRLLRGGGERVGGEGYE